MKIPLQKIRLLLVAVLLVVTSVGVFSSILGFPQALRFIFGLLAFYFPGWLLSYVFWDTEGINLLERGVISLALSLAFIPTTAFVLTKYNVAITLRSTLFIIIGFTIFSALGIVLRYYFLNTIHRTKIRKNQHTPS